MSKLQLRTLFLSKRRALNIATRKQAALSIEAHATRAGLFWRYSRIGIYMPHGAEINTVPLLNRMLSLGKSVYLPMLPYGRGRKLWFNRVEHGSRWHTNRYGMAENQSNKSLRAQQLDLLFMPLVGYDDCGYRIGMGGGYYDASLAFLRRRRAWRSLLLVGVAYACQHHPGKLPHDPWDIRLNAILTEHGFHLFTASRYK